MRRLLTLLLLLSAGLVRAETPALLNSALHKLIANEDHWAFTTTTRSFDREGREMGGDFVERYDPSLPFDRQWNLVKYDGRAPSKAELSSWKRAKEKYMSGRREQAFLDKLDLDEAAVSSETADAVTYLIPVRKNASKRFPTDKVAVYLTVDKQRRALTGFAIQPKESFRIAGVFRLVTAHVEGRLDVINPRYDPALTWVKGGGEGRLFGMFRVGRGAEQIRSEYQRVKPYNDRFEVKIGDVKALDF